MVYKNQGIFFPNIISTKSKLEEEIDAWARNKTRESFEKFYSNSLEITRGINRLDSELRLLLKQNPIKIKQLSIDF